MGNLLLLGKQYEAYVTVLAEEGGGTLIYIDAQGHIHVVPTGTRLEAHRRRARS